MESSKRSNSLVFDEVRKSYVPATKEELVRQKLLHLLIYRLGYPKNLITVEKQLSELPHLSHRKDLPERRLDIICFAKEIHPDYSLYPLLLIECKDEKINAEALSQVAGYNHYVQAHFVALASRKKIGLVFPMQTSFLPSFNQLLSAL